MPEGTREDQTMRFAFRQHRAIADVLRRNDDGDKGNYCFWLFSEDKQDDRYDLSKLLRKRAM
jgi:hypothetical protein